MVYSCIKICLHPNTKFSLHFSKKPPAAIQHDGYSYNEENIFILRKALTNNMNVKSGRCAMFYSD